MLRVAGWQGFEEHPASVYLCSFRSRNAKGPNRSAHRDVYQKTVALESPYRDQGGRERFMHVGAYRPAGQAAFALRGLPAAMLGSSRHPTSAGMARSVDAHAAAETAHRQIAPFPRLSDV